MNLPIFCQEYFALIDAKPWHFCAHQLALRAQVQKAFETEDLDVDYQRYTGYIGMGKYLGYGKGYEWERFLIGCFMCTFKKDGTPRWRRMLVKLGRGAGKDGCISWMGWCLISPYNNTGEQYDVDVGAYLEEQALRPVADVRKALNRYETKMKRFFKWTKELITCLKTGSELKGHANNAKGLDGLRPGAVFLDEIHAYEDKKTIEVFTSALGKTKHPRLAYFTTEGYVVDGPLDEISKQADECLFDGEPDNGWLYFICKLDSVEEADDPEKWHKANPSLIHKPELMDEIQQAYRDWKKNPALNTDFLCKRMNLKQVQEAAAICSWDELEATNKEVPIKELKRSECICGIDFSKTTDWASVNLHFVGADEKRYDINHAWICMQSDELWRLKCPYKEWAERGMITLVDAPEISPDMLADYIKEMKEIYDIRMVAMDSYRFTLLKKSLERVGFSVEDKSIYLIRPSDIMKIAPVILRCFRNGFFHWGDQPVLRWSTNNACLQPAKRSKLAESGELDIGNYLFGKQEPHARKTDPFMALVASMVKEDVIEPFDTSGSLLFDVFTI